MTFVSFRNNENRQLGTMFQNIYTLQAHPDKNRQTREVHDDVTNG
jgi:hypothetical protein